MQIPNFAQCRVAVIGDVMLDRYWRGPCDRISPEAPVPVVNVQQRDERPGGAANVAVNIASLGAQTCVLGVIGKDRAGQALAEQLTTLGIDHDLIALEHAQTISKLRVLSHNQQLLRLDFENPLDPYDPQTLLDRLSDHLTISDVLVLSDYAKGVLGNAQPFIDAARRAERPVLVDPKGRNFDHYRGATLLTPNLSEFKTIVGACRSEQELEDKARTLQIRLELQALLITRGQQGMSLIEQDQPLRHWPAQAREVFDVTGAGDTVIATLATTLAAGATLADATQLANTAASLAVSKLGTASVSRAELQHALAGSDSASILDEQTLLSAVHQARQRGERIAMTNGCFDILHAGHVDYLQKARNLGDKLIIAVNDDASTRRLKGSHRPINPLTDRLRVLSSLAAVDWLIAFSEDTPERLICAIKPDYLVKGGDYSTAEIAGAGCVRDSGGQVIIMDYLADHSTTHMIEQIRKD